MQVDAIFQQTHSLANTHINHTPPVCKNTGLLLEICTLQNQTTNPHQGYFLRLDKAIPANLITVFTGGNNPVLFHLSKTNLGNSISILGYCCSATIAVVTTVTVKRSCGRRDVWTINRKKKYLQLILCVISIIFELGNFKIQFPPFFQTSLWNIQLSNVLTFPGPPSSLPPLVDVSQLFLQSSLPDDDDGEGPAAVPPRRHINLSRSSERRTYALRC